MAWERYVIGLNAGSDKKKRQAASLLSLEAIECVVASIQCTSEYELISLEFQRGNSDFYYPILLLYFRICIVAILRKAEQMVRE